MGKGRSHSSGKKTKSGPDLLRLAFRSLRLRYQCVVNDIEDWEGLHTSHLLGRYPKQFDSVERRIGLYWDSSDTDPGSNPNNTLPPGVNTGLQRIKKYESQIKTNSAPQDLREILKFYKKWVRHLSGESNLFRLTQTEVGFQAHWEYFRQALQQRVVPEYGNFLDKVDIIARDCYYPLLKAAEDLTGKKLEQEQGWLSPVTVLKFDTLYFILSTRQAPLPYIFIPFDRMDNIWNLCAVHHEVAHDFFHKLNSLINDYPHRGTTPPLPVAEIFRKNVQQKMEEKKLHNTAVARYVGQEKYLGWLEEIFADFIGLMLTGPMYLHSLQEIQVDENVVARQNDYPPIYFRMLLNTIIAGSKLGFKPEADALRQRWLDVYGEEALQADIQKELKQENNAKNPHLPKDMNISTAGFDPNALTLQAIEKWLAHLVDSCWEAPLGPEVEQTSEDQKQRTITLQAIYEQLVETEYDTFDPRTIDNRKKHQRVVNETLSETVKKAQEQLKAVQHANCRPRHLVPALRLAYEAWVLDEEPTRGKSPNSTEEMDAPWNEKIRNVFLDSVQELPEVADAFKQMESVWEYDYGYEEVFLK